MGILGIYYYCQLYYNNQLILVPSMIDNFYIVFLLRVLRSFYNGAIAALSIYFFYRDITFLEARDIPLCISYVLLVAAIKAYLMLRFRKYFGHFNCLLLTYMLNLVALIAACDPNLAHKGSTYAYSIYFTIACFPFDGEDFGVCQRIEKEYILKIGQKDKLNLHKQYQRVGYIFQAFGSLALGYYYFTVMETTIDEKLKLHELLVFFILLQIICVLLNFKLLADKGTQIFNTLLNEPKSELSVTINLKVRLASIVQGFCCGLLSVNFLIYYCELKLDFYYDQIGKIVCSYFLFKGIGQDLIPNFLIEYPNLIKQIYFVSNLAVVSVAFFTTSTLTTVLLCCAFPFWHLGRSQIANKIKQQPPASQLRDDLRLWQRVGVALGVAATTYSFTTMYYRFIFAYPFILYAVVRQLNHFLINSLKTDINYVTVTQEELEQGTDLKNVQIQHKHKELNSDTFNQQQVPLYQTKVIQLQNPSKSYRHIIYIVIRFILYSILFLGLLFFYFNSIHDGKFNKVFQLMYQRRSLQRPKQLSLFNASLGQYLSKQDIKIIRFIDSNNDYTQSYIQKQIFQDMNKKSQKIEWLHFPEAPYFNSQAQIEAFFAPLLQIVHDQGGTIKGFSVFWKNPLRYHKIREQLRQKVRALGESIGFYYQQMPSLNLRGVQNKIVLVFGRQERKRGALPKFVEKEPPQNLLAFQTTFKMVMNLPEMREFFLYHLRAGVDKFFLYDNDPAHDDPSLFEGNRVTGYFKRCPRFALDQKYQIFQQIWQQFYDHIIYIPFTTSALNLYLELYPQFQAYQHYAAFFRQTVKYTSFTDFDEFIHSYSDEGITDTLIKLQREQDIATNYIVSKYFQFHICNPGKLNIQTYNYTYIRPRPQGQKVVIMNKLIVRPNVHLRSAKNGQVAFRGNKQFPYQIYHYQITTKLLKIIPALVSQFKSDKSMEKFVPGLKEACKGKCTDSFISNCTKQYETIILKEYCQPWNGQQSKK